MVIDRRVARTRTALYDGLVALILRKSYDDITVEEILREADVGRSTFYAHFTSKDDLLARSLERLRCELVAARDGPESGALDPDRAWGPSRALFEHVGRHRETRRRLRGTRGEAIVAAAVETILADLLRSILPRQIADMPSRELAVRHIVATLDTTLDWWVDHGAAVSPAEAEALFRRLAFRGVPDELVTPFVAAARPRP